MNAALYAMLAVGFGLTWRSLRVFHLAFGGLFVASGYVFHTLVVQLGIDPWLAGLSATILSGALGWLLETVLYRPFYLRHSGSGSVLIASMGALIVMENIVALIFGNELQTIPRDPAQTIQIGPVILTSIQICGFAVGAGCVTALYLMVRKMRTFKALWAMGDEPELIPVLGLPFYRLRAIAMALSAGMAAIPACLLTYDIGIEPFSGMSYLLIAAVAVLVGGANKYKGWVLGAFLLAMIQSLAVWKFSARWMDLATFLLLVVMLIFRPEGLIGDRRRMEEM